MSDVLFLVQGAVTAALAGDATTTGLIGSPPRLFDHVPPGAAFPYVTFGPVQIQPYDDMTDIGFEQIITLDIWSRYRGGLELKNIMQALYNVLHRATLSLSSGVPIVCELHSADLAPLSDGLTYHAALRFTVITQAA